MIARRVGAQSEQVENIILWGNHSQVMYPDVNHATVNGKPLREVVKDDNFLNGEFLKLIQGRGSAIIKACGKSSASSAASAACDHMHDWWNGTRDGQIVSMGVISDGNSYGLAEGVMYSFP